jgi:release factor glutamine methyltransferase
LKLKAIQNIFHKEIDTIYGKAEVDSFFFMLLDSYFQVSRMKLALEPDNAINKDQEKVIFEALKRLQQEEPIQYILGETEFFGLPFKVTNKVLIPRPETEELVEWVIKHQPKINNEQLSILDIGTGSGCIAISLAKNIPNSEVYALDISKEALQVAKLNAEKNDVSVRFIETDILAVEHSEPVPKSHKFDIIISNPPYVRQSEKDQMQNNVLDNEPLLALFVENEDPLKFYDAIAAFAVDNLSKNGWLYFEINEYLGNEMIQLLRRYNFNNIQLKQDVFKKDRMIKGQKMFD